MTEATLAQALARLQRWFKDPSGRLSSPVAIVDDYDVVFGQRYDAGGFLPEGAAPERPFEPFAELSAKPGTRAPHLMIERNGELLSIHDLFGRSFVLLSGDVKWRAAAERLRERSKHPLVCHDFISDDLHDPEGRWPEAYGVGVEGAVLIRPDGFVAWRSPNGDADAHTKLTDALSRIGLRVGDKGVRG